MFTFLYSGVPSACSWICCCHASVTASPTAPTPALTAVATAPLAKTLPPPVANALVIPEPKLPCMEILSKA